MALLQQQKLKQQQRLSPQQILAIRLIELPVIELEERIKNEIDENLVLEEGKEFSEDPESESEFDSSDNDSNNEDLSLGDYINEDDIPDYKLSEISNREEYRENIPFNSDQSLTDYLLQQLNLTDLSQDDKKIGEYLTGNIDDDGYLRRPLNAIADDLAFQYGEIVELVDLERVLKIIKEFDPPGVGASNLQECLIIQLERGKKSDDTSLAVKILKNHLETFTNKKFDKLKKDLGIDEEQLKSAINEITSLNPKPGSNWDDSASEMKNRVIPDFIVDTNNGELTLHLNNRGIPELRVNREYSEMFKDYSANKANRTAEMKNAVLFVKQKIDAAQGFIDAIKQRQDTLQHTMEAITRMQKDFFLTGDESKLHPMILRDVAEKTGLDISTISRVSNSKYVQTNFGIFPLKFFFSESAQTNSGETISTRKIKQIIEDEIGKENKKKPITDDQLTAILKTKGYLTARRTVAKYREQLGIPVARLRNEI